jgi:hypothetical protein
MAKAKKIIISLICLALLGLTFMIGGFVGFNNGYGFRIYQASIGDSYSTVRALEMINAGEISGAKKHLEAELDTQLIEHWSGLINKPVNFALFPQNEEAVNHLMSEVARYRKSNPRKVDDVKVEDAIQTVVNRYKK